MEPRPPTPSDPHTPLAEAVPDAIPEAAETASGSHTAAGDHSSNRPPPAPPRDPASDDIIGPYRVRAILGRGGMAVVYLADEIKLKRQVALKVLLPAMAAVDPLAKARFQREAEAQAAVEHDHIIAIYAVGEAAGVSYIAMPVLRGQTLAAALKLRPQPPVLQLVRIGREIAAALAAAHAKHLVHRDIKPGNIWLESETGRVKVLDFGLAREFEIKDKELTSVGKVVGTPAYMSPEQARGIAIDHRTDLFSLGVVLYQMATGQKPFGGETSFDVMAAIITETPRPVADLAPGLHPKLAALINQLLAKDPAARLPSAGRVVAELAAIEKALLAPPPAPAAPVVVVSLPPVHEAPLAPNPFANMETETETPAPVAKSGRHAKPKKRDDRDDEDDYDDEPRRQPKRREPEPKRVKGWWFAAAAAGVLLLVGAIWGLVAALSPSPKPETVEKKEPPKPPPKPPIKDEKKDSVVVGLPGHENDRAAAEALIKYGKLKLLINGGPEEIEVAMNGALPQAAKITITEMDFGDSKTVNTLFVSNVFIPNVSALKSLTQVRMKHWQIELNAGQVALMANMPLANTLVRLDAQIELTAATLTDLKKFKALDDAAFFVPQPTDALFERLATDLARLQAVTLIDQPAAAGLTAKGWEALAKMPRLVYLSVVRCAPAGDAFRTFTTRGATAVPGSPGLEFQGGTGIDDDALLDLSTRPTDVRILSFRNDITDTGLDHLAAVKSLRRLILNETKATEAGVLKLQAARPEIEVLLNGKTYPAKKK